MDKRVGIVTGVVFACFWSDLKIPRSSRIVNCVDRLFVSACVWKNNEAMVAQVELIKLIDKAIPSNWSLACKCSV